MPKTSVVRDYRRKLIHHRIRGYKAELAYRVLRPLGFPVHLSELRAVITRRDGSVEDYGVIGRRCVTNVGVQFVADGFRNTVEPETMNYHDSGTGTNAESVNDTTLQTPTGIARSAGTQTSPANGAYRTVAAINYTGPFAITEHGVFSATSSGVLLDRTVFPAINVASGDSITFTYTITWLAGG